jgi:hypothetical protein
VLIPVSDVVCACACDDALVARSRTTRLLRCISTRSAYVAQARTEAGSFDVPPWWKLFDAADIGPNPEAPQEPAFGAAIALRSELALYRLNAFEQ